MPCDSYICPNGDRVPISMCERNCPHASRCLSKTTLEAIAAQVKDRGLEKFSVTELIRGTRESYFMKTANYAVDPSSMMFALHGTGLHAAKESATDGNIITELRLENEIYIEERSKKERYKELRGGVEMACVPVFDNVYHHRMFDLMPANDGAVKIVIKIGKTYPEVYLHDVISLAAKIENSD